MAYIAQSTGASIARLLGFAKAAARAAAGLERARGASVASPTK